MKFKIAFLKSRIAKKYQPQERNSAQKDIRCRRALINFYFYLLGYTKVSLVIHLFQEMCDKSNGGFFSWIGGSKTAPTLLSSTWNEFPFFAARCLLVEEEVHQTQEVWDALSQELVFDEVSSVEAALKKCSTKLSPNGGGVNVPNSNDLPIYKWAQQILDTDCGEIMQVLFCHKFCQYYLTRPKEENGKCVGPRFFDGIMYTMYFNRVKSKVKAISGPATHTFKEILIYSFPTSIRRRRTRTFWSSFT